ncbi:MAG: multidrug effflux MFS transporter [Pseudomonadota bacterium]
MTLPSAEQRQAGRANLAFLVFLATMTSIVALTIDAILPALDAISDDLGFAHPNDRQLLIFAVFAGLGVSQLVFGPLSDAIGRKRAALIGWGLYLAGTVIALTAVAPWMMFAGRALQGIGAGGPRLVATAMVRDLYEGRAMARILSLVMTIFMAVPMIAPLIGWWLEALGGWRAIFGLYLTMAMIAAVWYVVGVPETLAPERRRPLAVAPLLAAMREVLTNRTAMAYTGAAICTFAPFAVFLATAQQVLEELYGLGAWFPYAFGALAFAFALSSMANARLVMRFGMRTLSRTGMAALAGIGGLASLITLVPGIDGVPPLWVFMALMGGIFTCVGLLFANLNALALQPLGHIAGTASAVVMSLSTLGSAPLGYAIASRFDGSLTPMFTGFLILGLVGAGCLALAEARLRAPST